MQATDARVGHGYRISLTSFNTGQTHAFSGEYLELSPHERIRYIDSFDHSNLAGQMVVTVMLRAVQCGTELTIVQEGAPAATLAELCHLGWHESLGQFAMLAEPAIP